MVLKKGLIFFKLNLIKKEIHFEIRKLVNKMISLDCFI